MNKQRRLVRLHQPLPAEETASELHDCKMQAARAE